MYEKRFDDEVADGFRPSGPGGRAFAEAHGMRRPALRPRVARDPRRERRANKASRPEYDGGRRPRAVEMVVVEGLSCRRAAEIMGCKHGAIVAGQAGKREGEGAMGPSRPEKPIGRPKPETPKAASTLEELARELEAENARLAKENARLRFEADVARAVAEAAAAEGCAPSCGTRTKAGRRAPTSFRVSRSFDTPRS